MFTGIVDHCGVIREISRSVNAIRILIECEFTDLQEGESIAVDGMCLTAVAPMRKQFYCDISPETLQLTTANEFVVGSKINLERSLKVGDRLGGHWVTGHIDQSATIQSITPQQEFVAIEISNVKPQAMPYLVKKGSIAVNGVSLTINHVLAQSFEILLIPHTLQRTNLQALKKNSLVNLEFDLMAKTIFSQLQNYQQKC